MPKFDTVKIFKIAETSLNVSATRRMLEHLDATVGEGGTAQDWWKAWVEDGNHHENAAALTEIAGRMCYKSFGLGLNANLTRTRSDQHEYVGNILKTHHGSVLEHASVTFAICGISRVGTHELVRHRAGTGMSQESMRFVRVENIRFYYPKAYGVSEDVRILVEAHLTSVEETYKELLTQLMREDVSFAEKKKISSALRRILPDGILTDIVFTANHRAWRHMIEVRAALSAEEEIQYIFMEIAKTLQQDHPALYQDMTLVSTEEGDYYTFANSKI